MSSDVSVVEALLKAGADPNKKTDLGYGSRDHRTPLHYVVFRSIPKPLIVEALIAAGADPKAQDKAGKTPFDYAKDNKAWRGTDAYWRLNEVRFQ